MKGTLFDYGVGNLHSLRKGFENAGVNVEVVDDARRLLDAELVIFPGVGAFGKVAQQLAHVRDELRKKVEDGLPLFAVCIGLQILYETSEESEGDGIGLFRGRVCRLKNPRLPHIGWNSVNHSGDDIFRDVPPGQHFYFVHSYASAPCEGITIATAEYGNVFTAAVRHRNLRAVQFHPEKSSDEGKKIIRNFLSLVG